VELEVPLSVAAFQALVVEAGGLTVAIPGDAVRRAVRVRASDLVASASGMALPWEGRLLPFIPLERLVGGAPGRGARDLWSAAVLAGVAVGVDRLVGSQRIVVQPLPELAGASPIVAGAAQDAAGNPRLVLDPGALAEAALAAGAEAPAEPEARPPILVVDDSLTTRMLEQSILESAGFEVDLAVSGEEALGKARRRRYSLFLVDVEMPGMDGFELVEQVRSDPLLRDIPAILVTSRSAPADRRRGAEVGAAGFVVKSEFDQADLLSRIRRLLG
jgi:two-component system chemotaxis sensor kinase CheA